MFGVNTSATELQLIYRIEVQRDVRSQKYAGARLATPRYASSAFHDK
jgi:hypothetical protein